MSILYYSGKKCYATRPLQQGQVLFSSNHILRALLLNICLQFFIIKTFSDVESNRSLVIGQTSLIGF